MLTGAFPFKAMFKLYTKSNTNPLKCYNIVIDSVKILIKYIE